MTQISNEHYRLTTRRNGVTIVNVFGFPIMHDNRSYNDHLDYIKRAIEDLEDVKRILTSGLKPSDVIYNLIDYRIGNDKKSITARIETNNRFKMLMEYLSIASDTIDVNDTVYQLMDMQFESSLSKYNKRDITTDTDEVINFLKDLLKTKEEEIKLALSTLGD